MLRVPQFGRDEYLVPGDDDADDGDDDGDGDGNGDGDRDGVYSPNPHPSPFRDPVFGGSPYPLQYGGCGVPGLQVRLPLDSLVQGENISSQLGENIHNENIYNENISSREFFLVSEFLLFLHTFHFSC